MRYAIVIVAALVLAGAASADERETKPTQCSVIEKRSFGFIKCRYRPESAQWRITYGPTAHKQVVESGQYEAMLRTMCDAFGDSIYEKSNGLFNGWSRTISCIPEKHATVP